MTMTIWGIPRVTDTGSREAAHCDNRADDIPNERTPISPAFSGNRGP